MKLVMEYEMTDGCTYSCKNAVPIEYESEEALIEYIDDLCKKFVSFTDFKERNIAFKDVPKNLHPYNFQDNNDLSSSSAVISFIVPEIYTLEDWWARNIT